METTPCNDLDSALALVIVATQVQYAQVCSNPDAELVRVPTTSETDCLHYRTFFFMITT